MVYRLLVDSVCAIALDVNPRVELRVSRTCLRFTTLLTYDMREVRLCMDVCVTKKFCARCTQWSANTAMAEAGKVASTARSPGNKKDCGTLMQEYRELVHCCVCDSYQRDGSV